MIEDKKNFNELVDMAMAKPGLATMRQVVEKELLHHEIFQALDADGLLKNLVFQGGTSLRLCRGSDRFSEDLDFVGGTTFTAESMSKIKTCLVTRIKKRFDLKVEMSNKASKVSEDGVPNVKAEKWWISIETAPEDRFMPRQKIKLEIANIPAHTRELVPIRDNYGFLGTSIVMVNAETLEEAMADKVLAFPTSLLDNNGHPVLPSSAKIRHRDIWDLAWMSTKGVKLYPELVAAKIADYGVEGYPDLLKRTIEKIPEIVKSPEFKKQMARFIDSTTLGKTLEKDGYSDFLASSVGKLFTQMLSALEAMPKAAQQIIPTSASGVETPKAKRNQDQGPER